MEASLPYPALGVLRNLVPNIDTCDPAVMSPGWTLRKGLLCSMYNTLCMSLLRCGDLRDSIPRKESHQLVNENASECR